MLLYLLKAKKKYYKDVRNIIIASEIGKVEDYIEIDKNTSEDISISFSAKYMMDALKTFSSDDITIFMNGDSK